MFADRYGAVVHLGERDCSVQRRHQKLIEESPSPAVSPELRERMGATAVAAAKAIGYEGAGTVEYLLDAAGLFYFMEMNTRLQVEHPVTEAVTGLDLVELQLRVAAGEPLGLVQEDIHFRGHAMEARLCCEDADQSFMPQSGTMLLWQVPSTIRVEHALASPGSVPSFYDSMIAKFVATGRNREDARRKLLLGLEDTVALGVTTNQAFLSSCLRHPAFIDGSATTEFIDANSTQLFAQDPGVRERATAIAALLLLLGDCFGTPHAESSGLTSSLPVSLRFDMGGTAHNAIVIDTGPSTYSVTIHEKTFEFALQEGPQHSLRLICNDIMETIVGVCDERSIAFRYAGRVYTAKDQRYAAILRGNVASDGILRASMSGRIVALHAEIGDVLRAGAADIHLGSDENGTHARGAARRAPEIVERGALRTGHRPSDRRGDRHRGESRR